MDIGFLYNEFKTSSGISTDTRKISKGQIFFALRGPNFNANKLAEEAVNKGARLAVIDDPSYSHLQNTYLTKDCLKTLQQLAAHHRDQLDIPVVGLTGSNGKTTTKELIREVLSKKYKTLATSGNLNNHIGVPLTVLSISTVHEMAIIEMGANHIGEIASLCAIAKPTHGLITNIGKAHIGEFGGFENIIRGKSELFDYLLKNDGTVFINTNDPVLNNMSSRFSNAIKYPADTELINADPFIKFQYKNKEVITCLIGRYNFNNIAGAISIGQHFGIDEVQITEALATYTPSNNRSQLLEAGNNTLILDAYNANPSSMEEAIRNFSQMNVSDKVVILGDMLELGDDTESEHYKIGQLVKDLQIRKALFVGPLMKSAVKANPEALYFESKTALMSFLKLHPITHSYILIKGSRGMALEQLVEVLTIH